MELGDFIAAGGLLFSVFVLIAITASFDRRIFISGLGIWVHFLFGWGVFGLFVLVPAVTFNFSTVACACVFDFLMLGSITVLCFYYIQYVKKKVWTVQKLESQLPPDVSLVPDTSEIFNP